MERYQSHGVLRFYIMIAALEVIKPILEVIAADLNESLYYKGLAKTLTSIFLYVLTCLVLATA